MITELKMIFERNDSMIKPEIHYSIAKYLARATQFATWPIAFIYFNTLFRMKITGQENLKLINSPFILISNHIAFFDSFVFRLVLGGFSNKLPLRFMAVNKFKIWYLNVLARLYIIDIMYLIFGVFVIYTGRGIDKNLEEATRIIKNGGDVVMYPEGSIMHSGKIEKFKLGAATLAKKTGAPVLPISMNIIGSGFRKKYIINVGKPIENLDYSLSSKEITAVFYNQICNLYDKK